MIKLKSSSYHQISLRIEGEEITEAWDEERDTNHMTTLKRQGRISKLDFIICMTTDSHGYQKLGMHSEK